MDELSNYKSATIRTAIGGWIVHTDDEYIFTSFNKAIQAVKEYIAVEKEKDGKD